MPGPLSGVKVVELAGLGALPFGSLKLADMGADVVRVDRVSDVPDDPQPRPQNFWDRGRRSIGVDLKHPRGVETVLRLAADADVFLESFRPGVVERLGLGPDVLLERNPRIVYGRLTGWGQDGPLAQAAGHSLNYEAITGVTRALGPRGGPPLPVLQILGDFAGGGLHLAFGVVCALHEAQRSGRGQVVDAAMVDGVMSLASVFYAMQKIGMHTDELGTNLFDGGAPFYNVYETSDGKYVSVAPIEPHFYALLLEKLGLNPAELPDQNDRAGWPELRERFAEVFRTRTRDQWTALLEGTDACYAPVLTFGEARAYDHNVARGAFIGDDPMPELLPTPRLSLTPGEAGRSPDWIGADTESVLGEAGLSIEEVKALREAGAIR
ncbi:MAG: CoA transferase [Deltaproteobacteria bacterium]|nr:CoA transferase [Deltaproteobacteria bacterium]MBW2384216.1 CoA transferase [Deltaproteobacteria bacterium]MBW2696549.1 CoA transferase [Deltaproteobacteria bacterium]